MLNCVGRCVILCHVLLCPVVGKSRILLGSFFFVCFFVASHGWACFIALCYVCGVFIVSCYVVLLFNIIYGNV